MKRRRAKKWNRDIDATLLFGSLMEKGRGLSLKVMLFPPFKLLPNTPYMSLAIPLRSVTSFLAFLPNIPKAFHSGCILVIEIPLKQS